jgi:sugar/nucleoside kinase (ribokinase family)
MSGTIYLIGNVNIDLVMGSTAPWPTPGTETILPHSEWRVGGAAGNSALALKALRAPYKIIANRGHDDFGRWLTKPFGAKAKAWPVSKTATALTVGITHPDGERTFFSSLGHLSEFSIDSVVAQLPELAKFGDVALLSGVYVLPKLRPKYLDLIGLLRARGFSVALDTGWPDGGWTEAVQAEALSWIKQCDHVLVNELEARSLASLPVAPVREVAAALLSSMPPNANLVIKRGPNGALAQCGNVCVEVAAPVITVVDTIGAGDVFNAGYLDAIRTGMTGMEGLQQAVTVASRAVSTKPRRYDPN